jgi:hypothetical protein
MNVTQVVLPVTVIQPQIVKLAIQDPFYRQAHVLAVIQDVLAVQEIVQIVIVVILDII